MWERQKTGSVLCPSCGQLVGVQDERCYNCGRRNPALWGYAPLIRRLGRDLGFAKVVISGSVLLYVAALLLDPGGIRSGGMFSMMGPSSEALFLLGASGSVPVFGYGRWWTLLSAGWLHGGLLHIGFNMLWVNTLAPPTAELYGPGRMIIIYTLSSVAGFLLSSVFGYGFTVGASAPIFGLLGALVLYGRRGGSSVVGRQAWTYAIILFLFGFMLPGVDNAAHLGGFLGGYAIARILDPMRPERGDHLLAALLCLAATAVAIAVSVLTGLPLLR